MKTLTEKSLTISLDIILWFTLFPHVVTLHGLSYPQMWDRVMRTTAGSNAQEAME
jgi:hypothetical protein